MSRECAGICKRFEYPDFTRATRKWWTIQNGKVCRTCGYASSHTDIYCACCKLRLSTRPRNGKANQRIIELRGIERL